MISAMTARRGCDFVGSDWKAVLAHNGLGDFEALWHLEAVEVDACNCHRGGWSAVSRWELALPNGGVARVYIKRQQNFRTRSLRHPLAGDPTALREFRQMEFLRRRGIPCPETVYCAVRRRGREHRAVLVTEELDGFADLEELAARWVRDGKAPPGVRRRVVDAVAELIGKLHAHRIRHGCLYPKHLFARIGADGRVELRLIDLEKSGWRPLRALFVVHDLAALCQHAMKAWSRSERLRFLCGYLGRKRATPPVRRLWRRIDARLARRRQRRLPATGPRAS